MNWMNGLENNKMSKDFRTKYKHSLIECIVEDAIVKALGEIAANMQSHLEYRCNFLGDYYVAYNKYIEKKIDLRANLNEYTLPLTCSYKDVYNFMESVIKDNLYDRKDDDSNSPIVYVHSVDIFDSKIRIMMSVRLLQTKYDGTTADDSVIR